MSQTKLRIIYMGTPEFAVAPLQKLVENGANIVAVITAPDKPVGRGLKLGTSAVKDYAVSVGLPVLQPINLKADAFIEELAHYKADLQIVVAFRMLPEKVWSRPRLGTFNIHASLLPQYRGAAPINWAIINGETETGVTSFFLKHEIDTGNLIFQEKTPIYSHDNAGTLYNRLMHMGADLALKTLRAIEVGNYPSVPQQTAHELKHAPKIFKDDCQINWGQSAEAVYNFIRGLSPYPGAFTYLQGKVLKIFEAEFTLQNKPEMATGLFKTDNKTYLHFYTVDGIIAIKELQLEGKKRMKTEDFLRGTTL